MSRGLFEPTAVEAEVDRIGSLGIAALRARWRMMFGGPAPAALTKDIIKRLIETVPVPAFRTEDNPYG